jgi:tape measure domain-containing protein
MTDATLKSTLLLNATANVNKINVKGGSATFSNSKKYYGYTGLQLQTPKYNNISRNYRVFRGNENLSQKILSSITPTLGALGIVTTSFLGLSRSVSGLTDAFKGIVEPIDNITSQFNRFRVGTGKNYSNGQLMNLMTKYANDARTETNSISQFASRLVFLRDDINVNTAGKVASTISKANYLGGATEEEVQTILLQLSQGIASNQLSGDELKAIREAGPALLKYMVQGMQVLAKEDPTKYGHLKNASMGTVKDMGASGLLTGDVVLNSILKMADTIDKDFKSSKTTNGQLLNLISNAVNKEIYNNGDTLTIRPITNLLQQIYDFTQRNNGEDLRQTINNISDIIAYTSGAFIDNIKFIANILNNLLGNNATRNITKLFISKNLASGMIFNPINSIIKSIGGTIQEKMIKSGKVMVDKNGNAIPQEELTGTTPLYSKNNRTFTFTQDDFPNKTFNYDFVNTNTTKKTNGIPLLEDTHKGYKPNFIRVAPLGKPNKPNEYYKPNFTMKPSIKEPINFNKLPRASAFDNISDYFDALQEQSTLYENLSLVPYNRNTQVGTLNKSVGQMLYDPNFIANFGKAISGHNYYRPNFMMSDAENNYYRPYNLGIEDRHSGLVPYQTPDSKILNSYKKPNLLLNSAKKFIKDNFFNDIATSTGIGDDGILNYDVKSTFDPLKKVRPLYNKASAGLQSGLVSAKKYANNFIKDNFYHQSPQMAIEDGYQYTKQVDVFDPFKRAKQLNTALSDSNSLAANYLGAGRQGGIANIKQLTSGFIKDNFYSTTKFPTLQNKNGFAYMDTDTYFDPFKRVRQAGSAIKNTLDASGISVPNTLRPTGLTPTTKVQSKLTDTSSLWQSLAGAGNTLKTKLLDAGNTLKTKIIDGGNSLKTSFSDFGNYWKEKFTTQNGNITADSVYNGINTIMGWTSTITNIASYAFALVQLVNSIRQEKYETIGKYGNSAYDVQQASEQLKKNNFYSELWSDDGFEGYQLDKTQAQALDNVYSKITTGNILRDIVKNGNNEAKELFSNILGYDITNLDPNTVDFTNLEYLTATNGFGQWYRKRKDEFLNPKNGALVGKYTSLDDTDIEYLDLFKNYLLNNSESLSNTLKAISNKNSIEDILSELQSLNKSNDAIKTNTTKTNYNKQIIDFMSDVGATANFRKLTFRDNGTQTNNVTINIQTTKSIDDPALAEQLYNNLVDKIKIAANNDTGIAPIQPGAGGMYG